jgi:predicted DNA-binding transcriptional regulator YafY
MPDWMFISKHTLVLSLVAKNPRITAQELATTIGMTERQVRRVIADLYDSGYINKTRIGRGVKYRINPDLSLRHDTHAEIAIGDFLEALGWKRRKKRRTISQNDGAPSEA